MITSRQLLGEECMIIQDNVKVELKISNNWIFEEWIFDKFVPAFVLGDANVELNNNDVVISNNDFKLTVELKLVQSMWNEYQQQYYSDISGV